MGSVTDIPGVQEYKIEYDPVVYFLLQDNTVVYVGQTKHLEQRIRSHWVAGGESGALPRSRQWQSVDYQKYDKPKVFNRVFILRTPVEKLDIVESVMIRKFQPIFNGREKKSKRFICPIRDNTNDKQVLESLRVVDSKLLEQREPEHS